MKQGMELSRRGFLGMGAAAAASLGLTSLVGCAPKTVDPSATVEPAQSDASAVAADWLGAAPEIAEDQIAETVEVDALCVGAGVPGLIAACHIGELGGKALVVEKMANPSSFRTDIGAIDSRLQLAQDVHIDKAALAHEIQMYCTGQSDGRLLKVWFDESGEAINWLLDFLDKNGIGYFLETDPGAPDMMYREWPVTHGVDEGSEAMTLLVEHIASLGSEVRFNTKMVKLEREEGGRVTGAICQNLTDGTYYRVNAAKGVVLATGGYANNNDMLRALNGDMFGQCVKKEMTPSQDGDGIKAAMWVGADKDPDGLLQIFERGLVPFGPQFPEPSDDAQLWWPGSQPFLRTTLKGERFSNESTPYDFSLYAIRQRHDNTWVQLFDANWLDHIAAFKTVGCSRIFDPGTMPGWGPTIPLEAIMGMFEGYVAAELIVKADTIAELAEKIGADPAILQATVARYNELCEKGVDEDFYKESSRMLPLTTAPFYAARVGGMLLSTGNGLRVDGDMRVCDTQGEAIEGLFATGNDCGGTYARTYPSRVAGMTMGRNITFSRHIARYMMGVQA